MGIRFETVSFDVETWVLEQGVKVQVFAIGGLQNRETDPEFDALHDESVQGILADLNHTPIHDDPVLKGFRDIHTALGFSNRTFPPASENLLAYIQKYHRLPRINLMVDIYNLVSAETRLALGAHDLERVTGNVHLRQTDGSEGFQPLDAAGPKPVRPGGYAYIDDANDVICLLEVKQVEKTKVTLDAHDCLYIVQGNAVTGDQTIRAAVERLIHLTTRFCGGQARLLYEGQ